MSRPRLRFRGSPLALLVIALALVWIAVDVVVGARYLHDLHRGYEGTVREIRDETWLEGLTLMWVTAEHLVIETAEGETIDRYVPLTQRLERRIAPGDHVVKRRGFGEYPRVPGKPTVSELLEAAGP